MSGGGQVTSTMTRRDRAITLLRRAGIDLLAGDRDAITVRMPDGAVRMMRWGTERSARDPDSPLLVVVDTARSTLLSRARTGEIDLIGVSDGVIVVDSVAYGASRAEGSAAGAAMKRRYPWGRWAVIRSLVLSGTAKPQTDLATASGITQGAVSLIMRDLDVVKSRQGWRARDRRSLLSQFVAEYPGPGGVSTDWLSLKSLDEQTRDALDLAGTLAIPAVMSGDLAADRIAAWRRPTSSRIFARQHLDLTEVGATPTDPPRKTLRVTVPDDGTVFATAAAFSAHATLADPLIVLWELRQSTWSDAREAADHLEATLAGSWADE
jgi:hypothetical protein